MRTSLRSPERAKTELEHGPSIGRLVRGSMMWERIRPSGARNDCSQLADVERDQPDGKTKYRADSGNGRRPGMTMGHSPIAKVEGLWDFLSARVCLSGGCPSPSPAAESELPPKFTRTDAAPLLHARRAARSAAYPLAKPPKSSSTPSLRKRIACRSEMSSTLCAPTRALAGESSCVEGTSGVACQNPHVFSNGPTVMSNVPCERFHHRSA